MSAWIVRGIVLGLLAFIVLGPLANLVLWAAAEQWYFPHKLPVTYGTKFWQQVFKPRGDAIVSLMTSIWIALSTVAACLALAIPAGYALARLKLPWRVSSSSPSSCRRRFRAWRSTSTSRASSMTSS